MSCEWLTRKGLCFHPCTLLYVPSYCFQHLCPCNAWSCQVSVGRSRYAVCVVICMFFVLRMVARAVLPPLASCPGGVSAIRGRKFLQFRSLYELVSYSLGLLQLFGAHSDSFCGLLLVPLPSLGSGDPPYHYDNIHNKVWRSLTGACITFLNQRFGFLS